MKTEWIQQDNHQELVIFFNGWGMDRAVFKHIDLGDRDLFHCFDYREASLSIEIGDLRDRYESIHLVAWSMGVAIANRLCVDSSDTFKVKLAISGSVTGIDDEYGIPTDAYQATIDGMNAQGRSRFHRRITEDRQLQAALDQDADRPLEEVCDELRAIRDYLQNDQPDESIFNVALIGDRDRIFPPKNLIAYWLGRADIRIVHHMPHMPLAGKISIDKLIEYYG